MENGRQALVFVHMLIHIFAINIIRFIRLVLNFPHFYFFKQQFFPHITTVETVFTYPQSNEPKHSQNKVKELDIYVCECACECV